MELFVLETIHWCFHPGKPVYSSPGCRFLKAAENVSRKYSMIIINRRDFVLYCSKQVKIDLKSEKFPTIFQNTSPVFSLA
jgi:hypothetical protein